jgi:hypothetical protein
MNALDVAIKAILDADSTANVGVASLASGGIAQLDAEGLTPPYLIFQEANDLAFYAFGNTLQADHFYYMFRGFAVDNPNGDSGVLRVAKIADRLKTILTNPNMSVSGHTFLGCRFDRSYPPTKERDVTGQRYIYGRGVLVEIWIA